jgi:chemotaxis protein CheX
VNTTAATITATQKRVPLDPNWKSLLEGATLEVFEMMASTRLTHLIPPASAQLAQPPAPTQTQNQSGLTAMVGIAGVLCGIITIHCSTETAIRLASKMAGDEAAKDPIIVNDAIGELCNMVAGNFKAKVSSLADHCMLSVSTVITGENYALQSAEPSESLQVSLLFESSPVHISLITQS